jgi:D-beta-D-heptose 7-phosphate kinase/D-beta-D-heptose 1-phosphate adenosyltransferase
MLHSLSPARASELIARFDTLDVLVVGDVMLDRFIVGRVTRMSPEAPVPVVQFQSESLRLGGAANVAHNIAALSERPTGVALVGLVGADEAARKLRATLASAGLDAGGLVEDRERPTTEKVRVVTERHQQVARIDYEREADATGDVEHAIIEHATRLGRGAKALMVSDYLKGTVTRAVVRELTRRAKASAQRVPLIIDPKIPHLDFYAGATLVTPNNHEAEAATHRRIHTDDEARDAGREFRKRAQCDAVLITRGDAGMWVSEGGAEGSIPAVAREVADVTGAGDTVAATLALALAAGATLVEAAMLANYAAGIVVGKFGPATVSRDELLAALGATS